MPESVKFQSSAGSLTGCNVRDGYRFIVDYLFQSSAGSLTGCNGFKAIKRINICGQSAFSAQLQRALRGYSREPNREDCVT